MKKYTNIKGGTDQGETRKKAYGETKETDECMAFELRKLACSERYLYRNGYNSQSYGKYTHHKERKLKMKIQKVIDICKKSGELYITETKDGQWIGNGRAVYPLYEFPKVTIDDLCVLYEITQEQRDKMILNDKAATEYKGINFGNPGADEEAAEILRIALIVGGVSLVLLKHKGGISFIKRNYLTPFKEEVQIWRRVGEHGEYFVVSCGMFVSAIILPESDISAEIAADVKEIATML